MTNAYGSNNLVRVLARWDVLALAFGAMIGWGWIALTGQFIVNAGSGGAMLAFAIGGAAIGLIGLTYAELASAMPQVGGAQVYSFRALGHLSSFVCTWALVFGYVSVVAFEAVALPTVAQLVFPNYAVGHLWTIAGWDVKLSWVALGVIGSIAMMIVNYFGVTTAALIQKGVTAVIAIGGVLFVLGAIPLGNPANLAPLFTNGAGGLALVLIMVPFLFVGFDVIPQTAEEINLPFREIGRVLMLSVFMAMAFYILMILGTALVLTPDAYDGVSLAVPVAAQKMAGGSIVGSHLVVVIGIAGILTSWNAFYIGGSRAIYALAQAGMLPAAFARLHPKYRTPVNAIVLIGVVSSLAPLLGRPAMVWLVNAGGLGIVIAYLFVAISFVVLRRREPELERPYKAPFGEVIGAAAVLMAIAFVSLYVWPGSPSALSVNEWAMCGGWMLLGFAMYGWSLQRYGREYSDRIMQRQLQSSARAAES
jgi:amino acid transporter